MPTGHHATALNLCMSQFSATQKAGKAIIMWSRSWTECNEAGSEWHRSTSPPWSTLDLFFSSLCSPVASDHSLGVNPSTSVCAGKTGDPEQLLEPTVKAGRTGAHRQPAPSLGRASPLLRGNVPVETEGHAQMYVLAGTTPPIPKRS